MTSQSQEEPVAAGQPLCTAKAHQHQPTSLLTPSLTYFRACGRDDHVPGSLDPGLAIHLHGCGLEEGDTEVGSLGDADARAQPTLDLALVRERANLA